MPLFSCPQWVKDFGTFLRAQPQRVSDAVKAKYDRASDAVAKWFAGTKKGIRDFWRAFVYRTVLSIKLTRRWLRREMHKIVSGILGSRAVAFIHRYRILVAVLVAIFFVSLLSLRFWPAEPTKYYHHSVFHVPRPYPIHHDAVHRVLPRDYKKDSLNGDWYYLVNILGVPAQTLLLMLGGFVAWRTVVQNHRFKQHEVEASCIKDYLAIEERLLAAKTKETMEAAVRSYWVLMLYEYYWWRNDLLSREIFTNWCEFRIQRFVKNDDYIFPTETSAANTGSANTALANTALANTSPPITPTPAPANAAAVNTAAMHFTNYQGGYNYFREQKVFPSPSPFDDLMMDLIARAAVRRGSTIATNPTATSKTRNTAIRWQEIERYRHGWGPPI